MVAAEHLRAGLRGCSLATQLDRIEHPHAPAQATVEHRITVVTLRSIAARIRFLHQQTDELDPQLAALIAAHPAGPTLLAEPGVGPIVAAQLLISWSHHGRVRSEAAFTALAGTAPLQASSRQRTRHRLNRGGDRDLNRALHTVAITRLRCHPETRAYHAQRTTQGKTHREIRRCLKHTLTRRLYQRIQTATHPRAAVTPVPPDPERSSDDPNNRAGEFGDDPTRFAPGPVPVATNNPRPPDHRDRLAHPPGLLRHPTRLAEGASRSRTAIGGRAATAPRGAAVGRKGVPARNRPLPTSDRARQSAGWRGWTHTPPRLGT